MNRIASRFQGYDRRLFMWVNQRQSHILEILLANITHTGGATFTLLTSLSLVCVNAQIGLETLSAVIVSHIPVFIIKRLIPRRRPYLVIPQIHCKKPLKDYSFPSGHTTAIFAFIIPIYFALPVYTLLLFLLGTTVGISRIYLGHHYPSDCVFGAVLGSITGIATVAIFS